MKRHGILSVLSAVMFILVFSISASAVEGILVGPDGEPLDGFSKLWVMDGKPQPVYSYVDGKWYETIQTGTDESGTPICRLGPSAPLDKSGESGVEGSEPPDSAPQCFSGSTFVLMADGSTKMIKDIAVGEKVMGYDFVAKRFTSCEVTDNHPAIRNDYYVLNGGLKVTAEHPFYAENFGITPVSTRTTPVTTIETQGLKPYANLYGFNGSNGSALEKIALTSIEHVTESGTFYNLKVDGTRNFFVSPDGGVFISATNKTNGNVEPK